MKQPSTDWYETIETAALLSNLTACRGERVWGKQGYLQIALAPSALRIPPPGSAPAAWLLPLTDVEMVRLSVNLPGRLLWLSPRPPRLVAGALVGDFEGAWWNGTEACVKLNAEVESCFLPPGIATSGSLETLALIVALHWSGQSQFEVQAAARSGCTPPGVPARPVTPYAAQLAIA